METIYRFFPRLVDLLCLHLQIVPNWKQKDMWSRFIFSHGQIYVGQRSICFAAAAAIGKCVSAESTKMIHQKNNRICNSSSIFVSCLCIWYRLTKKKKKYTKVPTFEYEMNPSKNWDINQLSHLDDGLDSFPIDAMNHFSCSLRYIIEWKIADQ